MNRFMRWIPVWRRNLLVWRKQAVPSLLANFGEPLLYLLALGYGLGAFVGEVQGQPYIVFLASGVICSSAMNAATLEGTYSAFLRMVMQQTWEGIMVTPLGLRDVVLGELIWAGTKALINAAPILVVAAALGAVGGAQSLWVLPLLLFIGVTFAAMALVITALAKGFDFYLYYMTLVVAPMFLLSGVFFPLQGLPEVVRLGIQFLPLTHAVELVRPLMTGAPLTQVPLHLTVMAAYTVLGYAVAVRLFRRRLIT